MSVDANAANVLLEVKHLVKHFPVRKGVFGRVTGASYFAWSWWSRFRKRSGDTAESMVTCPRALTDHTPYEQSSPPRANRR